jgi:hypothetical protein
MKSKFKEVRWDIRLGYIVIGEQCGDGADGGHVKSEVIIVVREEEVRVMVFECLAELGNERVITLSDTLSVCCFCYRLIRKCIYQHQYYCT